LVLRWDFFTPKVDEVVPHTREVNFQSPRYEFAKVFRKLTIFKGELTY